MPRTTPSRSIAEQIQEELHAEIADLVSQIAAEEGPAPRAQYVSDEHEVEMWGRQDPKVDHDTLVQQLQQGAVPPHLLDPTGDAALALITASPEAAALFHEPLDQEMATLVATLAEYPLRLSLLAPYTDDPEASVKKATSLTERWRRRLPPRAPLVPRRALTETAPVASAPLTVAGLGTDLAGRVTAETGAPDPRAVPPPAPAPSPAVAPAMLPGAAPPPRPGGGY